MKHFYTFALAFVILFSCADLSGQRRVYRQLSSYTYNDTVQFAGDTFPQMHRHINRILPRFDDSDTWEVLYVPIVFHVLYSNSDDRVTMDQINEQLASLNEDFSGRRAASMPDSLHPDGYWAGVGVDTKIQFCHPLLGNLINNVYNVDYLELNDIPARFTNDIKLAGQGLAALDPTKYLNVWIVPDTTREGGYAQWPGRRTDVDGIVINARFFGASGTAEAPYNEGRTLTHLVGTYLGLGDICGEHRCADDGLQDTPLHNARNFGFPSPYHYSGCTGNPREMTMNFMDYTDDAAMYLFTHDQAEWMRAVLSDRGMRPGLLTTPTFCHDRPLLPLTLAGDDGPTGSAESAGQVKVFPNPANTFTTLYTQFSRTDLLRATYSVVGADGRLLVSARPVGKTGRTEIQTAEWVPGMYFVRVMLADGEQIVRRIVVR